jgi:hypothetical protein
LEQALDSPSEEDLVQPVMKQIDTRKPFDATYWFHLTRTLPTTTFGEGILPLGRKLDSLWDMLFQLVEENISRQDWLEFRQGMESDYPNDTHINDNLLEHRIRDYRLKTHLTGGHMPI